MKIFPEIAPGNRVGRLQQAQKIEARAETIAVPKASWKKSEPPTGRSFLALARRANGTQFAAVVVKHIDGNWRLAELPDGNVMDLVIDCWIDIPPLRSTPRARRKMRQKK